MLMTFSILLPSEGDGFEQNQEFLAKIHISSIREKFKKFMRWLSEREV